jgi:hypothetical protein
MDLTPLFKTIEDLPVSEAIRTSSWWFPSIETVHVVGLVFVIGSIAMVDLRLMNLVGTTRPVRAVIESVIPWTWAAFTLALATGLLLFGSNAVQYAGNGPFRIKMCLMLVAALNMGFFHLALHRTLGTVDQVSPPSGAVRVAGALSITLWMAIVFCGRWIGFVL